ncbi:serine hydrolase [Candidatus Shapirobacteria bacterium]|nr:serine hydrolase [Candidatus Shapirobacteria bacterium]
MLKKQLEPKEKISGQKLKKGALILGVFTLGVALGALGEKLLTKKGEENIFFRERQSEYQFINPLLDFTPLEETRRGDLVYLREKIEELINTAIESKRASQVAVYFQELNSGAWIGIGEREKFAPASLLKLPLMIAYLKIAEENPDYLYQKIEYQPQEALSQNILPEEQLVAGQSYSIGSLIRRMIVYSDNQALEVLADYVEKNKLAEVYADLGLKVPAEADEENFITVKDYAALFRILYNASYLSREMSEKALKLLSEVTYDDGLVGGVPEGIKVAHKFGERAYEESDLRQFHDCGIIYYPHKPYLLCVMSRGSDLTLLQQVVRQISQAVYQTVSLGN